MVNKTYLILALSAIALFASCSSIREEIPDDLGNNELTATLESGPDTRTHLSGMENGVYYPYWSGDEEIAVFVDGQDTPQRFFFVSGKDTRVATFSGPGKGNHYVAFYPSGVEDGLSGNTLTLTLPSEQVYKPDTFAEGAFPMLAVSATESLAFKNLCAVLKIPLTGKTSVQSIMLTVNDSDTPVSGKATVRVDEPDTPALSMMEGGGASVRLVCSDVHLSEGVPTDFFIVIPPGTYRGGFTLKIKTDEGTAFCYVDGDVRFERSQVRALVPFECSDFQIDPEDLPDNVILYKTQSGSIHWVGSSYSFDRQVLSNTYENGQGMIVFDGPLKTVGTGAFSSSDVTEVILPDSVETIDQWAFRNASLKSFTLPDNLQFLRPAAFSNCTQLARFDGPYTTPDGQCVIIDRNIVAQIVKDEVVTFPDGVHGIQPISLIFYGDTREKVKSAVFPEGFVSIGSQNISDLPNLEYITLSSTCEVGQGIFTNCPSLKRFLGNNSLIWDDGNCLVTAGRYLTAYAGAGITDYVIPEGVWYLNDGVFAGKLSLRSLTFPDSFITLINRPFEGADNLVSFYGKGASKDTHSLVLDGVVMAVAPGVEDYTSPEGATKLGRQLFGSCVKKITLNDCVTDTEGSVFYNASNLETLTLSASLKYVGYYSFGFPRKLKDVFFRSTNPPLCGPIPVGVYFNDDLVVHVPEESLDAYRQSPYWSFFAPYFAGYHVQDLPELSPNGNVTVLQSATTGRGLDIVLMGDGFTEEQIKDGTYGRTMGKLADAFFSEEPYKSFRNYFNVYQVDVVSQTEGYAQSGQALGTWFGEGTEVGGNDDACYRYAGFAVGVPEERLENVLIVVVMNARRYGGTCYMYNPCIGDYGYGTSFAYIPLGETDEEFAALVHHEAGGHGFAKLADEYAYESNGAIPSLTAAEKQADFPYGWWKNCDFTDDPVRVKWSHFLADSRYRFEGLGCYEGGFTYQNGVWRPTQNSIMNDNAGGYNAPSREAIWYRIHKLAYGDGWTYDYEEFVSYDAMNRKSSAGAPRKNLVEREFKPTHPPVVIQGKWNERKR